MYCTINEGQRGLKPLVQLPSVLLERYRSESWCYVSAGGRLFHTVTCVSGSQALVVGGRMSPTNVALGMLWLRFPESMTASDPDCVVVELVNPQPAEDLSSPRWRHTTTEVTCQGKRVQKRLSSISGRSMLSYEGDVDCTSN